jgi:hypothetical protein
MNSDAGAEPSSPPTTEAVRRQVVDIAAELARPADAGARPHGLSGPSSMNLYLALLSDRLPVYARTMTDLRARAGTGEVAQNLMTAARATIQFYGEILSAKVSVFTEPEQLLQLRRALRARELGPHNAPHAVTSYLEEERALGRVAGDVDCAAAAHLLIGACVNHAFTAMLLEDVTPIEPFIAQAVGGLRLFA